ncbi:hypothetical protein CAPTEDRAFT_199761 [Capitella teleta]|uniref:G-protein coupled receptors family 1 profile domain-containing protein n=1 Tax=Capitella teleta TaxID=283909 RepID=R7VFN9_CAPTE|nr:hypothetical protein CAPTEDRAFT_199761 [Capitella teleta]|eukprot:ELU17653.1 hypothetical protein CAPTEDRAFT_199761 [Capitella teleta]
MENSSASLWTAASAENVEYTKPWYPHVLLICEFIAVLNLLSNLMPIVAYLKIEQLHTPTNMLIFNQSVMDAWLSLAVQPILLVSFSRWGIMHAMQNKYLCLLAHCIARVAIVGSLLGINLLSIERAVAIFYPYQYYTLVTDTSVRRGIIAHWTVSVVLSILPLFGWNTWSPGGICLAAKFFPRVYNVFIFKVVNFTSLICTAILNISVAVVAKKKNRVDEEMSAERSGQFKIMKMLLKVVGVFYLFRMPQLLTTMFYNFTPIEERDGLPLWFQVIFDFAKSLVGLNSVFNALIYAQGSQKFRDAFKRLLKIG